jgi:glycosyltransferase involved in cell wall biosynthesis
MRIVLVLATSTGGIGQHVRSLAAGLVARGDVVAVAGPTQTQDRFDFRAVGATVVPLDGRQGIATLQRLLRAYPVDVVHAHGLRAGLVAGIATPRRLPLVVTWHNALLGRGPTRRLLMALELYGARRSSVLLGASQDLVDRARRMGARDARPGPVAAPPLAPPARTRDQVRAELHANGRPLVLAVGRLAPQKAYDVLLDAARQWRTGTPQPLVMVAGDGPEHARLQHRIDSEGLPVRLLGHRDDIPELLAAADVVVLTSTWEARALVAQEALRAGVPLVATAVGGVPELVGEAALLVPPGDSAAVAAGVTAVLDDADIAERLRTAGRERVATWPDEDDTVAQVRTVYEELAAR